MELEFEINDKVERHRIEKPVFYVGRGTGMDLRINDSSVSSRHARIVDSPDRAMVEDLGSTNGTRLNEELVREAAVKAGDILMFGRVIVRIISTGPTVAPPSTQDEELGAQTTRFLRPPQLEETTGLAIPLDSDLTLDAAGAAAVPERRVGSLLRALPRLATARKVSDFLDRLTALAVETIKPELVAVYFVDEATGAVERPFVRGPQGGPPPDPDPSSDPAHVNAVAQIMTGRQAVLGPRDAAGPGRRALHAPLVSAGRPLGLLSAWAQNAVCGGTELRLLALLANEAAAMLETVRYADKIRRSYEDLVKEQEALVAECEGLEAALQAAGVSVEAAKAAAEAAKAAAGAPPSGPHGAALAAAQTAELSALLDSLLGELRQPAGALGGMVDGTLNQLAMAAPYPMITQALLPARLALAHLHAILNDVGELADLQGGRVGLETGPVDAVALLNEVQHFEGMGAQAKNVKLQFAGAPKVPVTVFADPKRLVQTLHHLVVTAVKVSPPGSEVVLGLAPAAGRLRFSIRDPASVESHGGPGLVIARRLVTLHGARLEIEEEEETGGTVVRFELPLP